GAGPSAQVLRGTQHALSTRGADRETGKIIMTQDQILQILRDHKIGILTDDDALGRLKNLPFEDIGFANIDHHRSLRQGFPEVVFGAGKSPEQVRLIVESMYKNQHNILITRATEQQYARVKEFAPEAEFHETARAIAICRS